MSDKDLIEYVIWITIIICAMFILTKLMGCASYDTCMRTAKDASACASLLK